VNLFVANTDYDWYRFLEARTDLDEVNFWKPSGSQPFAALTRFEPLVFKLKKAHGDRIVGFGFFVVYRRLDLREAWDAFGPANGAASIHEMWDRVRRYVGRPTGPSTQPDHLLGCIMLTAPVFFPPGTWVDAPRDWRHQTVVGKTFDATSGEGRRIWQDCLDRAASLQPVVSDPARPELVLPGAPRFGTPQLVTPRLGQETFRFAVEAAYGQCAVTREHALPALEAAHIRPYAEGGPHDITNGLLLRADVHKLFDRGYVTVSPDYRFRVSPRLDRDFHNGRIYYELDGREIARPRERELWPDRHVLEWHADERFLAR
jgi:putative restriction endonuclease